MHPKQKWWMGKECVRIAVMLAAITIYASPPSLQPAREFLHNRMEWQMQREKSLSNFFRLFSLLLPYLFLFFLRRPLKFTVDTKNLCGIICACEMVENVFFFCLLYFTLPPSLYAIVSVFLSRISFVLSFAVCAFFIYVLASCAPLSHLPYLVSSPGESNQVHTQYDTCVRLYVRHGHNNNSNKEPKKKNKKNENKEKNRFSFRFRCRFDRIIRIHTDFIVLVWSYLPYTRRDTLSLVFSALQESEGGRGRVEVGRHGGKQHHRVYVSNLRIQRNRHKSVARSASYIYYTQT